MNFDIELLGNCDAIICELCKKLGPEWQQVIQNYEMPQLDKDMVLPYLETDSSSHSSEEDREFFDDDIAADFIMDDSHGEICHYDFCLTSHHATVLY